MLRIRPYKPCDAPAVVRWFEKDERAFYWWSAGRFGEYPITPEDLNRYYDGEKDNDRLWPMTAFDETGVVGHFQIRLPQQDLQMARLGFIAVDSRLRGKGCGGRMVRLALRYAVEFLGVRKVTLGVFAQNAAAQKCYQSCGFRFADPPASTSYRCMGEQWESPEMEWVVSPGQQGENEPKG